MRSVKHTFGPFYVPPSGVGGKPADGALGLGAGARAVGFPVSSFRLFTKFFSIFLDIGQKSSWFFQNLPNCAHVRRIFRIVKLSFDRNRLLLIENLVRMSSLERWFS